MQYLLTEEEYKNLANAKKAEVTEYVKAIDRFYRDRSEFIAQQLFGTTSGRFNPEIEDIKRSISRYDEEHSAPKPPFE